MKKAVKVEPTSEFIQIRAFDEERPNVMGIVVSTNGEWPSLEVFSSRWDEDEKELKPISVVIEYSHFELEQLIKALQRQYIVANAAFEKRIAPIFEKRIAPIRKKNITKYKAASAKRKKAVKKKQVKK